MNWPTFGALASLAIAVLGCADPAAVRDGITGLTVSPAAVSLVADDSAPLTATATTSSGTPVNSARIAWGSRDTTIVRVDQNGRVFAVRQGTTSVVAFAGTKSASATVTAAYPALSGVREYAHRGFGTVFPENTLVAADSALARGADGVEADVQVTSDSAAVIIHDATVDRTTNGTGTVSSMSLAELRALDACSKKGPQWTPCQIPLAEEMIAKVRGRGMLILDLKGPWPDSQLRKLLAMVRDYGMTDVTMVTSFELDHLTRVRRLDARITLGWLQGDLKDPTPALDLGKVAIIPEEGGMRKNPGPVAAFDSALIARGSVLGAWTVYSPNAVPGLKALGVRWFIADIPLDKATLSGP